MPDNWNQNDDYFTMSLFLSNVILHQLRKNDNDELVVNYRAESLRNDTSTENLVAELHRVFNAKPGKVSVALSQTVNSSFGCKRCVVEPCHSMSFHSKALNA